MLGELMKALRLKLAPTDEQYQILDEMFRKWASLCNRYNRYYYQKMGEEDIKNILKPKIDTSVMQFSKTQVNQKIKSDNADLIRAMKEQKKQKENELEKLQERRNTIDDAITKEDCKETDIKGNIRPKGWFKFHKYKYWKDEIKNLDRQIKGKQRTIDKIEKGKIYFKPKRVGLWSTSFEIGFKSKTLILKPFANGDKLSVRIVTVPLQPHRGSSLRSKEFLERAIKSFLTFSLHTNFFGLANDEGPLINYNILEDRMIPKRDERFNKDSIADDAGLVEFDKRVKEFIDSIEKKIGRKLNRAETESINKEKERLWHKDKELKEIFDNFKKINELKRQILSKEKRDEINNLENEVRTKRKGLLSQDFFQTIQKIKVELLERKSTFFKAKYDRFPIKIKNLENLFHNLTEDEKKIILNEGKKAFSEPDKFNDYKFSNEYVNFLERIAEYLIYQKEGVYGINKYPILFRPSAARTPPALAGG